MFMNNKIWARFHFCFCVKLFFKKRICIIINDSPLCKMVFDLLKLNIMNGIHIYLYFHLFAVHNHDVFMTGSAERVEAVTQW